MTNFIVTSPKAPNNDVLIVTFVPLAKLPTEGPDQTRLLLDKIPSSGSVAFPRRFNKVPFFIWLLFGGNNILAVGNLLITVIVSLRARDSKFVALHETFHV